MGIVRTLLALAVVLSHAGSSYSFIEPGMAVEMFYVASGFLISFALLGNPIYRANWAAFYANRALRLYPIYFAVLLFAAGGFLVFPDVFARPVLLSTEMSTGAKLYLWLSNILLFGQDWNYFLGLDRGHLVIQPDFWQSQPPLWTFYPIPQAWTLGIEVSFYALAPLLLLNERILLLAFMAAAALKIWSLNYFGGSDPWLYRIFAFELSLFLLGAVSHQWFVPAYRMLAARFRPHLIDAIVVVVTMLFLVGVRFWARAWHVTIMPGLWEPTATCVLFSLALPALSAFQRSFKIGRWQADRAIGELSYPIYITHWLMISLSSYFWDAFLTGHKELSAFIVAGMSIFGSLLLITFVAWPLDRLRKIIRNGGRLCWAGGDSNVSRGGLVISSQPP
jgi:peptidoglycan/LPS O-acetylase OafA/YrhL